MRELYDQLIAAGEPGIEQFVTERRQENISLEFKTKSTPSTGEPNRDDKRNPGKELSAFRNSMDGLIVWGIAARKDEDGVDCATELQPIANIERFKSDVTRLVSQALMPRHEGILVEAIPAQEPHDAGYLAIYVERSERRPHRAELGVGRYFKRIGDSSVAMEHYDIEDSFKRLVVPWLEVDWYVRPHGTRANFRQVAIEIYLRNPSPVTARFPYLRLSHLRGVNAQPQVSYALRCRISNETIYYSGGADDVIHPGVTMQVAILLTPEIPVSPREGGQCHISRDAVQPVTLTYQYGCYNSRPVVRGYFVPEDQLVERGIVGGFIY